MNQRKPFNIMLSILEELPNIKPYDLDYDEDDEDYEYDDDLTLEFTIELGYMNFELLKHFFGVEEEPIHILDNTFENPNNRLMKYIFENPNYLGFITVKYYWGNTMIYVGGIYLTDCCLYWDDELPPSIICKYLLQLNTYYLEEKLNIQDELESLIIHRNHKHYTRQLLNKKLSGNILDEIMKFI